MTYIDSDTLETVLVWLVRVGEYTPKQVFVLRLVSRQWRGVIDEFSSVLATCTRKIEKRTKFPPKYYPRGWNRCTLWIYRMGTDSKLGQVYTLRLSYCENVHDVSALGGVHTLDLSHCRNVTDVSALGRVHTLYLYSCVNVRDVSVLSSVPKLYR